MLKSIDSNKLPIAPFTVLGKKIESKVRKAAMEFSLIETNHIAIAFSGGKDSILLLIMLNALRARGFPYFDITCIFISGAFTCGASVDTKSMKSMCASLNAHFEEVVDSATELRSCYPCSRSRRSLLFSKTKELGISTIAFGHHKDDVNETALMNLLKKGSFEGMLPSIYMEKFQTTIIRPLYYVDERESVNFARLHDYLRISCKCPNGATSERHTVKLLLQNMNKEIPDASNNLFRAINTYGSKKALTP